MRAYRVSLDSQGRFRLCLFAGSDECPCIPTIQRDDPLLPHFGREPVSIFGSFRRDDVYQHFTYVNHTNQPSDPSALMLADAVLASRPLPGLHRSTLSRWLHTQSLPTTHAPIGY